MGWGDILMAMGEAKAAFEKTGRRIVMPEDRYFSENIYWGAAYKHLHYIIREQDVEVGESPIFFRNGKEIAPYIDWSKSNSKKVFLKKYKPKPADLVFSLDVLNQMTAAKKRLGDFILIEPHIKATFSSVNKDWGFTNFQAVVDQIDVKFVQPDYGLPLLKNVTPVKTSHFLDGAALLAISNTSLLPEGGLMHAAAALNIPSVIIFGGFSSPDNTGYDLHKNLHSGAEPCGSREYCKHCASAMKKISPRLVTKKLKSLFKISIR